MSVGRGAVLVGESTPGAEAHDVLVVAEEDRGPVGARRLEQRVESDLEHLAELARARHGVGEAVDRIEIAKARAQFLPLAHIAGSPEHEAKLAVSVPNSRNVRLEP